jgi:hypothetical protein
MRMRGCGTPAVIRLSRKGLSRALPASFARRMCVNARRARDPQQAADAQTSSPTRGPESMQHDTLESVRQDRPTAQQRRGRLTAIRNWQRRWRIACAGDRLRDDLAAAARAGRDPSPETVTRACELALELLAITAPRAMSQARTECQQALVRLARSAA